MARVITGGQEEFNALVYGHKHPRTMEYLENQAAQAQQYLTQYSDTLSDAGRAFFQEAQTLYDHFNGSEAMRLAQAAINRAGSVFQSNTIRDLWELGDLQNAPPVMQRWIMANPVARDMYHQQRCDGYSDSYIDMDPDQRGMDHYDYRRVIDGVVQVDEEHGFKIVHCFDELREGDRHLQIEEKDTILTVWEIVEAKFKEGKDDVTNKSGGAL